MFFHPLNQRKMDQPAWSLFVGDTMWCTMWFYMSYIYIYIYTYGVIWRFPEIGGFYMSYTYGGFLSHGGTPKSCICRWNSPLYTIHLGLPPFMETPILAWAAWGGMLQSNKWQKKTLPGLKYVFSYPRIHNSIRYTEMFFKWTINK